MPSYTILIARAGNNYSGHVPDVPGVAAVGDTIEEVTRNMQEALQFHLDGLALAGEPIPLPESMASHVAVDIPAGAAQSPAQTTASR